MHHFRSRILSDDTFPLEVESALSEYCDRRNVTCKKCYKKFKVTSHLKVHIVNQHLGYKRWRCTVCQFGSWRRSACLSHAGREHRSRGGNAGGLVEERSQEAYMKGWEEREEVHRVFTGGEEEGAAAGAGDDDGDRGGDDGDGEWPPRVWNPVPGPASASEPGSNGESPVESCGRNLIKTASNQGKHSEEEGEEEEEEEEEEDLEISFRDTAALAEAICGAAGLTARKRTASDSNDVAAGCGKRPRVGEPGLEGGDEGGRKEEEEEEAQGPARPCNGGRDELEGLVEKREEATG